MKKYKIFVYITVGCGMDFDIYREEWDGVLYDTYLEAHAEFLKAAQYHVADIQEVEV